MKTCKKRSKERGGMKKNVLRIADYRRWDRNLEHLGR